jgi:SAM-dependent methyltransferase
MTTTTGFSDVDRSGRSAELVDYLTLLASRLGDFRREGYEMLGLRSGTAFLDVGCGAGEVCVEIAGQVGLAGRVAGIDRSAAMIEAAGRAAKSGRVIDLRVGSAYELPFADQSFDAVRAERLLQHLEDPDAALRVARSQSQEKVLLMDPDHGQAGLAVDKPARRVFEAARRSLLSMIVNPHSGVRAGMRCAPV